jgi:hypothetical protein
VAGNIAVRLAYLRRRGLTYLEFAWATLLSNVLALAAAAALAVLATAALWLVAGTVPAPVLGLSAGVLALGTAALVGFHFLPRVAGHRSLRRWRWLAGVSGFEAPARAMTWVGAFSFVRHALNFITFGLLYRSVSGLPADFLTGGLVYALTTPVRMVNITPANLGVNEWAVALAGGALAFDVTTGLLVALVFRGIMLLAQALGAVAGWVWLARRSIDGAA